MAYTESADLFDAESIGLFRERQGFVLTANIVAAALSQFSILSSPEKLNKRFKWYAALFDSSDLSALEEDPSLLYICRPNIAPTALEQLKTAFLLVVTKDDEVPDWARSNKNRVLLVKSTDRVFFLVSLVQNLFTGLLVWENELDRIVTAHESLSTLLDAGGEVIKSFMCLTDSGYNLVASTTQFPPPDDACTTLVETGCYPASEITHIEESLLQQAEHSRIIVDKAHPNRNSDTLHMPMFFNGEYFFQLTLSCPVGSLTNAVYDLFHIFGERVIRLCGSFWEDIIECESPWHRVLTNYIEEVPMKGSYVETQLDLTLIPAATHFKLLCIEIGSSSAPTLRNQVVSTARSLNKGMCYPFAYNNSLLVLCYQTSGDESHFPRENLQREARETISEPFNVRIGISKSFTIISNIRVAYQQARLALNFSDVIDREHELADETDTSNVYTFDSAFPYYTIAKTARSDELVFASVNYSVVHRLADEDAELGTQSAKLLWSYLSFERNATAVSKRLHMHRNTVLYHIDKIEKRFGIDLDKFNDRFSLTSGFMLYFLSNGFTREVDYDKLLSIPKAHERTIS